MQVLTSCSLASFSLVDSFQSLCGRTLEILPPAFLAQLAGLHTSASGTAVYVTASHSCCLSFFSISQLHELHWSCARCLQ